MNPEISPKNLENKANPESYINPEDLNEENLVKLLELAPVTNIRPIEALAQKVPPHADQVEVGDIVPHADQLFEAEIEIAEGQKLLVVYKPESGINHGTAVGKPVEIPKDASPYMNKEVAAWTVLKSLGLQQLAAPVIRRDLGQGMGSVRPYIWGEPLSNLPKETIYQNEDAHFDQYEDIALVDYLVATTDRWEANVILSNPNDQPQLKIIDHSLTFLPIYSRSKFEKEFITLRVAYDVSTNPERSKNAPIPERLSSKINSFCKNEENIRQELSNLLTIKEIDELFSRAHELENRKIFL